MNKLKLTLKIQEAIYYHLGRALPFEELAERVDCTQRDDGWIEFTLDSHPIMQAYLLGGAQVYAVLKDKSRIHH